MSDVGGPCNHVSLLPQSADKRKAIPIGTGVLDYFPAALIEVAKVSKAGNDQHNPGETLHWARGKSMDQADTMIRHFLERGTNDSDGLRHSAKMAWRALALLQLECEAAGSPIARGAHDAVVIRPGTVDRRRTGLRDYNPADPFGGV